MSTLINIEDLRPLEKEALRIVRHGSGKYSWYQVARVLPVYDFPGEEQNASKILRRLEQLGLVESAPVLTVKDDPRYVITEAGLSALDQLGIKPSLILGR